MCVVCTTEYYIQVAYLVADFVSKEEWPRPVEERLLLIAVLYVPNPVRSATYQTSLQYTAVCIVCTICMNMEGIHAGKKEQYTLDYNNYYL